MLFLTCMVFEMHSYSPTAHLIKGCNFINTACVSCLTTILLYFSSHLTPSYVKRVSAYCNLQELLWTSREGRWANQYGLIASETAYTFRFPFGSPIGLGCATLVYGL